ncbi:acyl-ACP thioesterase domain-containing protein [Streptococcus parasanguinis]|uniref:acyl-ACP thioesterase domain-containing protein n=1 Tax=Streptococcus parasanguinis TaxID=1318 RepID=UPI001BE5FBEA|nr:acyl-ACP thioesterase domain-containing protein [Streptococcus parasanguinis]MBT3137390.1 acyl-[acyl-carrier-protein] thioesterase [Streptococcus parasanguinis]
MVKTFEYSMKIPFDMSDVNGYIKIPQLILLSLQVSGMQSIELGMSDMYILENYNLVWIITDYNMKIERLPVFDEKITIETYAKSHNRLFCYRAFNIKDEEGNTIIEMVATFVLMDRDTRKVHPVMSEITDAFDSEFSKTMLRGPRFKELEGGVEQEYRVRFYDLDMNGHVNNSKYLDWVFEVMGADFLTQHIPKKVHLKYVKEVLAGGLITSQYEQDGLKTQHQITSDGQINAQAEIEWEKVEEKGWTYGK